MAIKLDLDTPLEAALSAWAARSSQSPCRLITELLERHLRTIGLLDDPPLLVEPDPEPAFPDEPFEIDILPEPKA
jgi:hypothetical protein